MQRIAAPLALVLASLAFNAASVAGPINPPAGPVTSTGKTLTEVEPRIAINAVNTPGNANNVFVISQPGSYYLTGNVQGVSGKQGILIPAGVNNVTIDLNGFHLQGVAGSLSGIQLPGNSKNITVRNGVIDGWGADGINLSLANGGQIENVTASNNVGVGIKAGSNMSVSDCSALTNGGFGIRTETDCMVADSIANGNTKGIVAGAGTTVRNCVASDNRTDGIEAAGRCVIVNNVATGNGVSAPNGAGIYVTNSWCRIEGNVLSGADYGLQIAASSTIVMRNTCSGNSINWSILAGNFVAPIVQATTNSSAITGNTYTGNLGSTDANANFTY
ncbi:MAG TPA: right-handed parallel beta-helix repeat-containing protein [Phycisphaerales bacterium]|nr:right-handed parallel beta-helix repeat-containing protein [Phycisphaerales bacterium]